MKTNVTWPRLLSLCFTLCSLTSFTTAQTISCPPNLDFEFGDFSLWECQWGGGPFDLTGGVSVGSPSPPPPAVPMSIITTPHIGQLQNWHTITSGSGTDLFGGFPLVCPGGGAHSLRIGDTATYPNYNNNMYFGAARVKYKLHVPVGIDNYSLNFKYAIVFQDPNHLPEEQPRFTISITDSATGAPVNGGCFDRNFISALGLPGFFNSSVDPIVRVKPWTVGKLNLSGTAGQTLILDLVVGDCALSAHWGVAYFDLINCGRFEVALDSCDLDGQGAILSAPPGYQNYEWWDDTYTTMVVAGQTIFYQPTSASQQYYNVVLTPFGSVSLCKDTIRALLPVDVTLQALPDTSCVSTGIPIQLMANGGGGVGALKYQWTELNTSSTLNCYNCQQPVANTSATSFYAVKVTDSNGCFRSDTIRLYHSAFKPDAGPDLIRCLGNSITFQSSVTPQSSAFSYKWTPGAGLIDDTVLTPIFIPTTTGTTVFTFSVDSFNCVKTDTMTVKVLPNYIPLPDTAVCDELNNFKMPATGPSEFTYVWTPATGVSNPNILNPFISTDTTRTYTLTASYPTCPNMMSSFTVVVQPTPEVDVFADTVKCQWDEVLVNSNVKPAWYVNNYAYQWSATPAGGISNPSMPFVMFNGQQDATVKLIVRSSLGCSDSDKIDIIVHPGNFASITPEDTGICPGNSVPITVSGGEQYYWSPSLYIQDTTSTSVVSTPLTDIQYAVVVVDKYGCKDTVRSSIDIYEEALLDLGEDKTIFLGDTIQMAPWGNCLYMQWFPPMGLSQTNISNPYAYPLKTTTYYVTGTTEHGCTTSDSITIFVESEPDLEIPNAFTPSNSGNNTILKVIRRGKWELVSLQIFDRWGVMVFETKDINQGWDGRYKGTPQPLGVYVYVMEAVSGSLQSPGQRVKKQGNITLIR